MNEPNPNTEVATPTNPEAETANRIEQLKTELRELEHKNRPPVPEIARRLGIEIARLTEIQNLAHFEPDVVIGSGWCEYPEEERQLGARVEFGQPKVVVKIHASMTLEKAKVEVAAAVESLFANWDKLQAEAKDLERDLGRDYMALMPPTPLVFADDVPF